MRICLTGPSGAGKSTLSEILHSIYPQFSLLHGDDYVHRDVERIDELVTKLDSIPNYIFEHVSVASILKHARRKPDYVAIVQPPKDALAQQRLQQARLELPKRDLSDRYYIDQMKLLDKWNVPYQIFHTSGAALAACLAKIASNLEFQPPVQNFVLKVSSRCNLKCDYCYMYEAFDTAWKAEPALMSNETARQVGVRIAEYLAERGIHSTAVSFHGGEPLLLGPSRLERLVSEIVEPIPDDRMVRLGVQTNGVRLSTAMLEALDRLGFLIGVSIDGAGEAANRHRVDHNGQPAFRKIEETILRLTGHNFSNGSFGGVLCVINPLESGALTYRYLRSLGVRNMDFLLPDYTHDNYAQSNLGGVLEFLCSAFDAWMDDEDPCDVRLFQSVISLLFGDLRSTDMFGLGAPSTLVISAAGDWELLDTLRVVKEGAWKTRHNIFTSSVSDVLKGIEFQQHFKSKFDLDGKCIVCHRREACGGGYMPHRYDSANGFKNPTIYCADLLAFFDHVETALARHMRSPSIS